MCCRGFHWWIKRRPLQDKWKLACRVEWTTGVSEIRSTALQVHQIFFLPYREASEIFQRRQAAKVAELWDYTTNARSRRSPMAMVVLAQEMSHDAMFDSPISNRAAVPDLLANCYSNSWVSNLDGEGIGHAGRNGSWVNLNSVWEGHYRASRTHISCW